MKIESKHAVAAAVAVAIGTSMPALAQTELHWWHAMTGANNEVINKLAADFRSEEHTV